jgi:MFS family permease
MGARPDLLLRFLLLYAALYCSFGFSSPFLPEFLTLRGVDPESLGVLLGAGTAVRLVSAPIAGRLADVFGIFRLELGLFASSAAVASLLYLPAHSFWLLVLVNLAQAALLAPLAPLSDALALSWSRFTRQGETRSFEYGWVRGAGSGAFVVGALTAGQLANMWGLACMAWLPRTRAAAIAMRTKAGCRKRATASFSITFRARIVGSCRSRGANANDPLVPNTSKNQRPSKTKTTTSAATDSDHSTLETAGEIPASLQRMTANASRFSCSLPSGFLQQGYRPDLRLEIETCGALLN